MGYVMDTKMAAMIYAQCMVYITGTWTDAVATNQWTKNKAAAAETATIMIPVQLPQNSDAAKGSLLKSIDIWWEVGTAGLTTLTPTIKRMAPPADNTAWPAATAVTFAYDSANDTNTKRITAQTHKMTLTLDTPLWVSSDEKVYVEISAVCAAGSVFKMHGARCNYTARL